jgi:prepilin-type processing-associated H-X9-DG protein
VTSRNSVPVAAAAPLTVGLGVAILLPALDKAKGQANRIRSRANLSGIGKMLQIYVNGHNDSYPDSLQALVAEGLSPQGIRVPTHPELAYIYLKPGKDAFENSTKWVVAFEPPEVNHGEGANVLFLDGHVEFVKGERLNELLKAQGVEPAPAAQQIKKDTGVPAGTNPI